MIEFDVNGLGNQDINFNKADRDSKMSIANRSSLIWLVTLLALFYITSCDTTEPDPGNETEMITIALLAQSEDEGTLPSATFYDDDSDERLENPVERKKGTNLDIRAEADGYQPVVQTVPFTTDGEETFILTDEVTIDYTIVDQANELIAGADLYIADSLASEGPEGSVTVPYSNQTMVLCGRAEWFKHGCEGVGLDSGGPVEIRLEPETVSISITPEIVEYTDQLIDKEVRSMTAIKNTEYRLIIGDNTWVDNLESRDGDFGDFELNPYIREGTTTTVEYPAGPEPVEVAIRAVYVPKEGHPYSDEHYLNVAEGSMKLAVDSDSEIELTLAHVPACRDGVDNDFDGVADADEELACSNYKTGEYDPEDDAEVMFGLSQTLGANSNNKTRLISGAEDERKYLLIQPHVPPVRASLQVAMDVAVAVEVKQPDKAAGFALEYATGPDRDNLNHINQTEIVTISNLDDWGWAEFAEIDRTFFSEGRYWQVTAIHAKEIRGEPASDGSDKLIFLEAGDPTTRGYNQRWLFQPEDVPRGKLLALLKDFDDVVIMEIEGAGSDWSEREWQEVDLK
ncbi:MAG: hypothetical protein GVY08_09415 [Bacteroidetes bacterium]|jgi:hypothetical protein|nr:hypothetical protein [Bacteroidota bacterium]